MNKNVSSYNSNNLQNIYDIIFSWYNINIIVLTINFEKGYSIHSLLLLRPLLTVLLTLHKYMNSIQSY